MLLEFSSKAGTLAKLQGSLMSAQISPLVFFTVDNFLASRRNCISRVESISWAGSWIVRSSCQREDTNGQSNAGAFLSLLNVKTCDLEMAIEKVISSYGDIDLNDEVLIQPMLENVQRSGVAFSHDPNTCAPYRVINWSSGSDTTVVTGGGRGKTWQQAARSPEKPPAEISGVVDLLEELLALFGKRPVDCEFAITRNTIGDVIWLLQARPLLMQREPESENRQAERLIQIQKKVERGMIPHPFLIGKKTVYGVMPDWNPAEIIGVRPKPLALSLYRELITDSIWAYQRHNYGYRNLRGFPLMLHFSGLPYIDLRLSFNSFIPVDLEEGLAGRLVDYYINYLADTPSLHDKIEFEVVYSCYTLDLKKRLKRLSDAGFSDKEQTSIAESLRKLTNRIIHPENGLWKSDAAKLQVLNSRREKLLASDADPLERIYWLLEDAKRYGTLPFAGLARAGFVAVQMLKSLVSVDVFSQSDYDNFIGSVSTVSGQLARDCSSLDKVSFLSRYGHLRPGTYDILSPRYDEKPDLYFNWEQRSVAPDAVKPFSLTLPQMRELVSLLNSHGLHPDPVGLLDFLQAGIELREMAKFHFTRNLSDALALITEYGEQRGVSREDLAYCDLSVFKELHIGATKPFDTLSHSIEQGKARHQESLSVSLPPLIVQPKDVWAFHIPEAEPNFITQKKVTATVVTCNDRESISGSIVCIPNADPGFDWVFSYPIAGLITAWGGVNSHMAIRAGELGLPAVIGAGEGLYRKWANANRLHLDCAGRRVELLN